MMEDSRAPRSEDETTSPRAAIGRPSRDSTGKSIKDRKPRSGKADQGVPYREVKTPAGHREPSRARRISQGQQTRTSTKHPKWNKKGKEVEDRSSENEPKSRVRVERTARSSPRDAIPEKTRPTPGKGPKAESAKAGPSAGGETEEPPPSDPDYPAHVAMLLSTAEALWEGREHFLRLVNKLRVFPGGEQDAADCAQIAITYGTHPTPCFWLALACIGKAYSPAGSTSDLTELESTTVNIATRVCQELKVPLFLHKVTRIRLGEYKVTLEWLGGCYYRSGPGIILAQEDGILHAMPIGGVKRSYALLRVPYEVDKHLRDQFHDLEVDCQVALGAIMAEEIMEFEELHKAMHQVPEWLPYELYRMADGPAVVYRGRTTLTRLLKERHERHKIEVVQGWNNNMLPEFPVDDEIPLTVNALFAPGHLDMFLQAGTREYEWYGAIDVPGSGLGWHRQKWVDVVDLDHFEEAPEAKYIVVSENHPRYPGLSGVDYTVNGYKRGAQLVRVGRFTDDQEIYWIFKTEQAAFEIARSTNLLDRLVGGWQERTFNCQSSGFRSITLLNLSLFKQQVGEVQWYQRVNPKCAKLPAPGVLMGVGEDPNRLALAVMQQIVNTRLLRKEAKCFGSLIHRYCLASNKAPSNPMEFATQVDRLINTINVTGDTVVATAPAVKSDTLPWEMPPGTAPDPKSCPGCGRQRPEKYRWKDGMCDWCSGQEQGITRLAQWYVEGAQVPEGAPGVIHMKSRSLPLEGGLQFEALNFTLPHYLVPEDRQGWQAEPIHAAWAVGFLIGGAPPRVATPGIHAAYDAVKCRVFRRKKWAPNDAYWEMAWAMRDCVLPNFPVVEPMTVEAWLATMPRRRRRPLERAYQKYQETGYLPMHGRFQSFIKLELLNAFEQGLDITIVEETKNRLIQGPHDVAHVIAGPILKPFVHALKKAFSSEGYGIQYASRCPEEIDRWFNHDWDGKFIRVYFWCDYSMFDCTHSTASWRFVESLYRQYCVTNPDFWKVLEAWRAPKGSMRDKDGHRFTYQAPVMNASGRDDTAGANCLVNAFAMVLSLTAAWFHCSVLDLTTEKVGHILSIMKFGICGDDTLCILPELTDVEGFYARLSKELQEGFGLVAGSNKMGCSTNIFDAVFLGQRPYPVSGTDLWAFGPTLGRRLFKHHVYKGIGNPYAWLHGVAKMERLCYRHVPVLYEQAVRTCELLTGRKVTPWQPDHEYSLLSRTAELPQWDERTLRYLAEGYKMDRDSMYRLTRAPERATRLPYILDGRDFESIMLTDAC